jgi:hypothetical protein
VRTWLQRGCVFAGGGFLGILLLGQVGSVQPTFEAGADLAVVTFQVNRGGRPVFDLKPADVALLEDGNPRPFSIFEVPARRPVIELMVLFDLWDGAREALREGEGLYQIASDWNLGIAGAILADEHAAIRISVYGCDEFHLWRLSGYTADPHELLRAVRQLPDPTARCEDLKRFSGSSAGRLGWMGTVLQESTVIPAGMLRAVVVFAAGSANRWATTEEAIDRAAASGLVIFPVALGTSIGSSGIAGGSPTPFADPLGRLGDLAGGHQFHVSKALTSLRLLEILNTAKTYAKTRAQSSYTLGFEAPRSSAPREHTLEIRLLSDSKGSLSGGRRRVIY